MGVTRRCSGGDARRDRSPVAVDGVDPVPVGKEAQTVADPVRAITPDDELVPVAGTEANGRVGKERLVVAYEPTGVIGMEVGAHDGVDLVALDASGLQRSGKPAALKDLIVE